jgi:hypothetical protein
VVEKSHTASPSSCISTPGRSPLRRVHATTFPSTAATVAGEETSVRIVVMGKTTLALPGEADIALEKMTAA